MTRETMALRDVVEFRFNNQPVMPCQMDLLNAARALAD